jgi:hypothetical protein
MLLHSSILADPNAKVGDIFQGFKITKLDRDTGVCELEKVQTLLPTDGKEGQLVTLLADKTFGLTDPVKITIEAKDLFSGVGAPTADIGTENGYYQQLDATPGSFTVWGPKTNGAWPASAQYAKTTDLAPKITALETDNTANKTDIADLKTKTTATDTELTALDTNVKPRIAALEGKKAESEVVFTRSPTTQDVYKVGLIWNDVSFGVDTALRYLSFGEGNWQSLNRITLRAIRVTVTGYSSSYTVCSNIKFFDRDNKQIPFSSWVVGARTIKTAPPLGSVYSGGQTSPTTNKSEWVEFEPAAGFDFNRGLLSGYASFRADMQSTGIALVELHYTNGSVKKINSKGSMLGAGEFFKLPDAYDFQYGGNVISTANIDLTPTQASDPIDETFGRVSGLVLDSAFSRKIAPANDKIAKIEARKEVVGGTLTTVLVDGSTIPETTDFPRPSASGFTNDGEGDVAGATSWTNNAPIGVNIGQSGDAADEYEVSVGFGAANPNARITFRVGDVFQDYTASGVQAGTLDITEFNAGNWRGATLKVTGNFTGMVSFITTGSTYIGPVIRKKSKSGFAIENQRLALFSDLPKAVDLAGLAKSEDLTTETNVRTDADGALGARIDGVDATLNETIRGFNEISFQHQEEIKAETTARTDADTSLDGRLDIIETNLSKVRSVYCGTFDNQAGNTGHQFTQQQKTGNGITTTDNITFTLTGGIYRVEVGIMKHMAANTWRITELQVNGAYAESIYTGHDGGNWEGSGPILRYVDASASPQTIRVARVNSTGNGNAIGYLDIRQECGIVAPTGKVIVTPRNVTGSITTQAYEELDWPARIPLNSGEILASLTVNGTAVPYDAQTGFFVIPKGAGAVTIAHTTRAANAPKSARLIANAGTWVTFGSLQFAMAASGSRSFQIRSASGTISVVIHSWTGWDSTSYPFSATLTTSSNQYLEPAYGYGNSGNNQFFWIEDITNNRRYEGVATVGSAYNNNVIWVKEVT